jgi:hypothetical protein
VAKAPVVKNDCKIVARSFFNDLADLQPLGFRQNDFRQNDFKK